MFEYKGARPGLRLCLVAIAALLAIGVDAQLLGKVQRPRADLVSFSLSVLSLSSGICTRGERHQSKGVQARLLAWS